MSGWVIMQTIHNHVYYYYVLGGQVGKGARKRKTKEGRREKGWQRSVVLNTVIAGMDTVIVHY